MATYQLRNKTNHVVIVDISGKGDIKSNASNLKQIAPKGAITADLTAKRLSELKVKMANQISFKEV